jgi:hypothetical protein
MRVICGWCGILMKPAPVDAPTSHGLCPGCEVLLWQQAGQPQTAVAVALDRLAPLDRRD